MPDFAAERSAALARYLRKHTSAEVRFDEASRDLYATDASHYQVRPLGVVLPRTPDDLLAVVQIARDVGVSITPRGGGTSLTGQSIGPGIVVDCSKYLNAITDLDASGHRVRVQPGVVLDQLNAHLARYGLMFGPDVATANRATLGGMIGNNSAGARSVVYGQTVHHVVSLETVLADGSRAVFGPLSPGEYERKLELRTREGQAYRAVDAVVRAHAAEIAQRFPPILRAVSGYNLADVLTSLGLAQPVEVRSGERYQGVSARRPSLVPLLVGSEGTLAVVAAAELNLVPRPKYRGLLVPQFDSLTAALDALSICLELGPSAVELMDRMLIDLARRHRELSDTMAVIRGRPEALLMVEFSSDDAADVSYRVYELRRRLGASSGVLAAEPALDPATREPLWALRGAAVPLLWGTPGDRKPVTFVEDCAVEPRHLPEFTARFRDILRRHGTDGAFYGHASVGCLHIRPVLNLHDPADVRTLRRIMEDVTDLVLAYRGSLSGEHGDGLVRSEWNHKMFGPVVYEAFRAVKRAFDPDGLLNPGKIVDAPVMEASWRLPPGPLPPEPPTVFDYSRQGGFFRSVEACNGSAVCRKTQGGVMCPSYRATRDERDSTRGRANALRIALSHGLRQPGTAGLSPSEFTPQAPLQQRWLADVMDLCLSCKACKSECPANVDMAKLKAEFLHAYYSRRPRPPGHYLVRHIHTLTPWAAWFAGPINWLVRRPWVRDALQTLVGIDRRRSLPTLHRNHLRRWFVRRREKPLLPPDAPRVVLLDDCFTTFQEPEIGRAAIRLLERVGVRVELAGACCGRALISKGFLTEARHLARAGVARLAPLAAQGVPILGLEPSCLLTLLDEWPELIPGDESRRVAAAAELAEVWIAQRLDLNGSPASAPYRRLLFHPHCHQRALVGVAGTREALRRSLDADVTVVDGGCCGMAGAFGYEREHYDLSVAVARLGLLPALAAEPDALIVATGTSCRHQIWDLTGRRAYHPLELMAGADHPTDSP